MKLLHRMGVDWERTIRAGTWLSWLCVRNSFWDSEEGEGELRAYEEGTWENKRLADNDVAAGCIYPGFAADIVATDGDLEEDFENAISPAAISFVMKAGKVYKLGGVPCC